MAYIVPTAANLRAMYPAFTAVTDETIDLYIARVSGPSGADVDQTWFEGDYAPAIMAAAAHRMARAGVLATPSAAGVDLAGVESFKSASFSVSFNAAVVAQNASGGWASTVYGQDYLELLNRNKSGPRVTAPGAVPFGCGYNGYAGPLPPWQC